MYPPKKTINYFDSYCNVKVIMKLRTNYWQFCMPDVCNPVYLWLKWVIWLFSWNDLSSNFWNMFKKLPKKNKGETLN